MLFAPLAQLTTLLVVSAVCLLDFSQQGSDYIISYEVKIQVLLTTEREQYTQ